MRRRSVGGDRSARLTLLFLAVVVPPAVALVWLGLQLLQQDRALAAQRAQERRDAALQAAVLSLEQQLADAQRWLTDDALPAGAARLVASSGGVLVHPPGRALWVPVALALEPAATREFADAEIAEFQGSSARALETYQQLASSSAPAVRAGALLRVARVHRRERRWDAAVAAYRALALHDQIAIDGMPADLMARRAIAFVFEDAGRTADLAREAAMLEGDLLAGRWMLDHAAWELTTGQLAMWLGRPVAVSADAGALSVTAEWLWREWQRHDGEATDGPARRVVSANGTPVTLLLRKSSDTELVALAMLPSVIQPDLAPDTRLTLLTDAGEILAGPPVVDGAVRRGAADTGLPWTIVLAPIDASGASGMAGELAGRRRLLLGGLGALVLLLAGGGTILWRVVQQELAVARLRTNFVSAVSHEFRTPLASLRHVTELLDEHDELPRERRRAFYGVLARNTDRLQRLVESLLDFARMEDGRKPYDPQSVNVSALVRQVVEDFEHDGRTNGAPISFACGDDASMIEVQADPTSLTHAVWNLLDNAVKYSPEHGPVGVSVARRPEGAAIIVRDSGIGIPRDEQTEVFGRFVRGEAATRLGIKGTGLGLAIVSHIVQAHRGTVEVVSEEGVGSTFTVTLPGSGLQATGFKPAVGPTFRSGPSPEVGPTFRSGAPEARSPKPEA